MKLAIAIIGMILSLYSAYLLYRWVFANSPDWDAYVEREKEIERIKDEIMRLRIKIEVRKQLEERQED